MLMGLLARAKDYVVSSAAELETVMQQVQPGERITWKNGTYADIQIRLVPAAKGTADARIILQAETPGKVVFTGSSQLLLSGNYLQAEGFLFEGRTLLTNGKDVIVFKGARGKDAGATHCRVTNCAVIGYNPPADAVNYNWVSLQGADNELDHCYFNNKTHQGPYLVVVYDKPEGFTDGSDACPPTRHHIHHNYFGYRNLPTDNGGEDMRIGDSKTSFTKGFNLIEYNYFEEERNEPEVISNKSCNNIYRYNSFYSNDGALVLRHGNNCLVYNNYINGKSGRNVSGGIRVIGEHHTVFNNYLENQEGGSKPLKAPLTIMNGMDNGPVNGYFAAHQAVVCYNTVVNAVGPVIRMGVKNAGRDMPVVAEEVVLARNVLINTTNGELYREESSGIQLLTFRDNGYNNGTAPGKGFVRLKPAQVKQSQSYYRVEAAKDEALLQLIRSRLQPFNLQLTDAAITAFDAAKVVTRSQTGVSWIHQ
jgi:poly(beta-D-mannuronate) lyase